MEIGGNIPFHVARAYGVKSQAAVRAPQIASPAAPSPPASGVRTVGSLSEATAPQDVQRSRGIDRLVGGTVNRPISFDGAATPTSASTLQLYTRAADKIEAAVAVNVGRAIDVQG